MRLGVAHWLYVLLAFAVVTPVAMFVVFSVAVRISPPYTPEGYGVMPLGQAMLAIAIGPVLGIVAAALMHRRAARRARTSQG